MSSASLEAAKASRVLSMLALEHLRALGSACCDHIRGVAEVRSSLGDKETLERLAAGCMSMVRQIGSPHMPEQCVAILRRVGTEGAILSLGANCQPDESIDELVLRSWEDARDGLEECLPTCIGYSHHDIMGSVRATMLSWRNSFDHARMMSNVDAKREIDLLCRPLLVVATMCLVSASSEISEEGDKTV